MKPEIKQAWVAALRSGDYVQGRTALRYSDSYCCLGVLCDLAVKADVADWRATGQPNSFSCGQQSGTLPFSVQDWAGLVSPDPVLIYKGTRRSLSGLNDTERLNFSQIADLIEQSL
jgi:hypothetical protein